MHVYQLKERKQHFENSILSSRYKRAYSCKVIVTNFLIKEQSILKIVGIHFCSKRFWNEKESVLHRTAIGITSYEV